MKLLLCIFLSLSIFADECSTFLESNINFTQEYYRLLSKGNRQKAIEEYKAQVIGEWVTLENGRDFRYFIQHKNKNANQFHIHFGGLGSNVELETSSNQLLNALDNFIIVELQGHGAGELVHQLKGLDIEAVDMDELASMASETIELILSKHKIASHELTFSGHSFGGAAVNYISKYNTRVNKFTMIASGVASLNRYLMEPIITQLTDMTINWLNYFPGRIGDQFAIATLERSIPTVLPYLAKDPMKLKIAARMSVGLNNANVKEAVEHLAPQSQIMMLTAEKDDFIFPMMHFEYRNQAVEMGHKVLSILVENTTHYLPQTLSTKQIETIKSLGSYNITSNDFIYLRENGDMEFMDYENARQRYASISYDIYQKILLKFALIPGIRYPKEWMP